MLNRIVCVAVRLSDAFYQPLRATKTLSRLVFVDIMHSLAEVTLNLSVSWLALTVISTDGKRRLFCFFLKLAIRNNE